MRVFMTGASGWIGAAVVPELQAAGHQVVGIARSEDSARRLTEAGVGVRRGSLDDLDSLREGALRSDAVIHLAFKHDFSDFVGAGRTERTAIQTLLTTLEGSDRRLLFASGVAMVSPGRPATEQDESPHAGLDSPRGGAEQLAMEYADRGVRSVSLRFAPTVHGTGDHGFMAALVQIAREKGAAGYVGDGSTCWAAVHRFDAASMVRLALEKAPAGSRVHAVAEEGIPAKEIAEGIGRQLDVPAVSIAAEDAAAHFGWIGAFFGLDMQGSSELTRKLLGWTPTHPGLLDDLAAGHYFRAEGDSTQVA